MGQKSTKYDTDDPELQKLLRTVMGNHSAANLFWHCLINEPVCAFDFPIRDDFIEQVPGVHSWHDELGGIVPDGVVYEMDRMCIAARVSRFTVAVCAFSVLMSRYTKSDEFLVHHNYGLTGTRHRIMKFPLTRVKLPHSELATFNQLVSDQNDIIQKSSYHLCLASLPKPVEWEVDNFLGVFLLDESSGHSQALVREGTERCSLSLVIELLNPVDLVVRMNYRKSVISPEMAKDIYEQFVHTLRNCVRYPEADWRALSTVPETQVGEMLSLVNSTPVGFPELELTLHQLFIAQSIRTPNAVAVRQCSPIERTLTYAQLAFQAQAVAHRLQTVHGLVAGDRVGILLPRGVNQVVAILGILMADCCYVPVDTVSHPADRIDFILQDASVACLVSELGVSVVKIFQTKFPTLYMHEGAERSEYDSPGKMHAKMHAIHAACNPPPLAYIIYTSGSTGSPKGVQVPHRGIINDVYCMFQEYMQSDYTLISNVLFSTNICFDAHVDEVFLPLLFGGTITALHCAVSDDEHDQLGPSSTVSFVQGTPSVFSVVNLPASVKFVLIGGEALTRSCLERVRSDGRIVVNGYGPTETTNESSLHVVRNGGDFLTIGKPIWNTQFYVMQPFGETETQTQFAPLGTWGELYIGGAGVAVGYQNLPHLTNSVFLKNIHPLIPGRVYKTGDLVRIDRTTGQLQFGGRKSAGQIKLRGYRIELGEVQYQMLAANEGLISECHVGFVNGQICAYFVPASVDPANLLFGTLPDYMRPSAFVGLVTFPKTISGKLDLKRLPPPSKNSNQRSTHFACETSRLVADAFAQVLVISEVRGSTNFFSSGGNSLSVISLQTHLQNATGVTVKLQALFQLQTVDHIADWIRLRTNQCVEPSVLVPLSPALGTPFFCFHAAGGQVHTYAYLASGIPNLIGIQDPALTSLSEKGASFSVMAAEYAGAIHAYYPVGPVFVGGHSSGGCLAFETAGILESEYSRSVPTVFLFDTEFPTQPLLPSTSSEIERIDEIRHYLYNGWKEGLMHDYISAVSLGGVGGKLLKLLKAVLPRGADRQAEVTVPGGSTDLIRMISLLDHHLQIEKEYVPSLVGHFDIVQFRSSHAVQSRAWEEHTSGKFILVEVPDSNHYNIICPPAVDLLSAVVLAQIEQHEHTKKKDDDIGHSRSPRVRE